MGFVAVIVLHFLVPSASLFLELKDLAFVFSNLVHQEGGCGPRGYYSG